MKRRSAWVGLVCLTVVACIAGFVAATSRADASPVWVSQQLDTSDALTGVEFADADHGIVVGDHVIFFSSDGGVTWAKRTADVSLKAVSVPDATHAWAVGAAGTILASTDGGQSWTPQASGTTSDLGSVSFIDALHGWACAADGSVLVSTDDGGASWDPLGFSGYDPTGRARISFVDENLGWLTGGGFWRTDDGGATWDTQGGVPAALITEWVDAMHGWAWVTDGALLYRTVDGGVTWEQVARPEASVVFDIVATDAQRLWAIVDSLGVFASDDGGETWVAQGGDGFMAALSIVGDRGWAVGHDGILIRSGHNGYTDLRPPVTTAIATPGKLWNGAPVTVSFTATDNKAVAATYYRIDDGAWQQGTSVVVPAPSDHSFDGLHHVWTYSVDAYGNEETAHEVPVAIDTQAPVTRLSAQDRYQLDYWTNKSSVVAVSATDAGGSSLDKIFVNLGGAGFIDWQDLYIYTKARADHSNDGVHTIDVYSTDVAGNAEAVQYHSVSIDTRRPVAKAPYASSCRYHGYATFKFKIVDSQPCASVGFVSFQIRTLSGAVKKTMFPKKTFKKNITQSYRFHCALRRGKYRFFTLVQDGAGNISAKAAANSFTVR